MANSKISALAAVTSLGDSDEIVLAVGGATKKMTGSSVKESIRVKQGRANYGGTAQLSQPGWMPNANIGSFTNSQNRATYFPFVVSSDIVIDRIVVELTTGASGSTNRICLYNADADWQPTSLVSGTDTGAFNTTASEVGVISYTVADVTLAAGRYLAWVNASHNGCVFRATNGNLSGVIGYSASLGATPGFTQIYVAQTYGAPPSTGLAWTTVSATNSSTGAAHPIFLRVKTP